MTFSSCLTDHDKVIVLDASVIINLLATTNASAILQALTATVVVTGNVVREIDQGAANSRKESKLLAELIDARVVQMKELVGPSLEHFFYMVSGRTSDSLGDGEAATLAFAYSNGFSAAIDEKKATRIAGERFEATKLVTTVDILAYGKVLALLGQEELANATLKALQVARMQVRAHQFDWVAELIGESNLANCVSLKRYLQRKPEHPTPLAISEAIVGEC
jgi:predicted nucleic acid-binding protein